MIMDIANRDPDHHRWDTLAEQMNFACICSPSCHHIYLIGDIVLLGNLDHQITESCVRNHAGIIETDDWAFSQKCAGSNFYISAPGCIGGNRNIHHQGKVRPYHINTCGGTPEANLLLDGHHTVKGAGVLDLLQFLKQLHHQSTSYPVVQRLGHKRLPIFTDMKRTVGDGGITLFHTRLFRFLLAC